MTVRLYEKEDGTTEELKEGMFVTLALVPPNKHCFSGVSAKILKLTPKMMDVEYASDGSKGSRRLSSIYYVCDTKKEAESMVEASNSYMSDAMARDAAYEVACSTSRLAAMESAEGRANG